MSSRLRATLTAASLLAATFGSTVGAGQAAADPTKERPAAGCRTVADDAGDARLNNRSEAPNDPDLDIQTLTLRSTATSLLAYTKVANLGPGPAYGDGHRFSVNFTFNGSVFSMSGSKYKNGTGALRDGLAQTGQAGGTTQLGVNTPSLTAVPPNPDKGFKASGLKVTFDEAGDYVVMDLPIADIVKYAGKAFTGSVTSVAAVTSTDLYAIGAVFDTTNANNSQTTDPKVAWTIGDNRCFTVPTKLALSVTKLVASRTVTAKLTTATGQAIAGKQVVFFLNGRKAATLTTASNGTAVLRNVKPGSSVKAQFLPVSGYLGSTATTKV